MAIFTSGTTPFVLKAGDGISIKSAANSNGTSAVWYLSGDTAL